MSIMACPRLLVLLLDRCGLNRRSMESRQIPACSDIGVKLCIRGTAIRARSCLVPRTFLSAKQSKGHVATGTQAIHNRTLQPAPGAPTPRYVHGAARTEGEAEAWFDWVRGLYHSRGVIVAYHGLAPRVNRNF
jgi:hypothetical protein